MKLSVVVSAARTALSVISSSSSVSVDETKATISSESLTFAAEFGAFIKKLSLSDNAVSLEQMSLEFFKTKTDSAALIDVASKGFVKALTDSGQIQDEVAINYLKQLSDIAAFVDSNYLSINKALSDGVALLSDDLVLNADKLLSSQSSVIDVIQGNFQKANEDAFLVEDALSIAASIVTSDSTSTSDITLRTIAKAIQSGVNATDDVDGQASIEDDQEVLFFKSVTNVLSLAESIAIVFLANRSFQDSLLITDLPSVDFFKPTEDGLSISESIVLLRLAIREPSDTLSVADSGSLRGQGYCSFDYFNEDYVGYSTTF